MKGLQHVLDAYKQYDSRWTRYFVMKGWSFRKGKETRDQEILNLKKMHFFKTWPKIKRANDPGNIHWHNIGVNKYERRLRQTLSWLAAIFSLIICIMLLVSLKEQLSKLKENASTKYCPSYISIEEAQLDARLPKERQFGLMNCYCKDAVFKDIKGSFNNIAISFE